MDVFRFKKIWELNYTNFQGIKIIQKHINNNKGNKKTTLYTNENDNKKEIPYKYLNLVLKANPNMKFVENKKIILLLLNHLNNKENYFNWQNIKFILLCWWLMKVLW